MKLKQKIKFIWQKLIRGWSDDETWALNMEFIKWINKRCKRYLKLADKVVKLDYYKFKYKKKEYTQKDLIIKLIELSNEYLDEKNEIDFEKQYNLEKEISYIWSIIIPIMWW